MVLSGDLIVTYRDLMGLIGNFLGFTGNHCRVIVVYNWLLIWIHWGFIGDLLVLYW